jgi:hypothetical protein
MKSVQEYHHRLREKVKEYEAQWLEDVVDK